ncbi:MAG TPA: hypothetical protein PLM49_08255 [Bacteroidales bacterium]|nr:hypothetical protein [Bacteroidales bacterium]
MKRIIPLLLLIFVFLTGFSQENDQLNKYQYFDASVFPEGIQTITIYSRDNCGRCGDMMQALQNAGIDFKEVPTNTKEGMEELDKKIYNALPDKMAGYSTRYPVVELNNVLYYTLANHAEFTELLIAFMKQ